MSCKCCESKDAKGCKDCGGKHVTGAQKWKYSLMTTVIFLVIVHPRTYLLVQSILGKVVKICSASGCPTMSGLLVHAVVFTVILRYVMDLDI